MNNSDFENILDRCIESLLVEGGTVKQCLERFPEHADELRPLLETFLDGREAAAIRPGDAYRSRARNEFQAALREAEESKSRSFFSFGWLRQPQWASAAIAVAVLLAMGGTAAAAGGSMPDQFLYPVKRATEQVQLAFTFTQLGKAELNTRLADRRGEEIIYLVSNRQYDRLDELTEALDNNLNRVAENSIGKPAATVAVFKSGRTQLAEKASPGISTTAESMPQQTESQQSMPQQEPVAGEAATEPSVSVQMTQAEESAEAEMPAADAAQESTQAEVPAPAAAAQESEAVPEEPTPPEPTIIVQKEPAQMPTPEAKLVEIPTATNIQGGGKTDPWQELLDKVSAQSGTNLEQLYKLLEQVPESARPALLKAISVSENGYMKALEALLNRPR